MRHFSIRVLMLTLALTVTTLCAQDFKKQVIYQVVTDRFFDGDTTNNNPAESPGLYDSSKTNWQAYWGGNTPAFNIKSHTSRASAPQPSGFRPSSTMRIFSHLPVQAGLPITVTGPATS